MKCCGEFMLYDNHTGDNVCKNCGKAEAFLPPPIFFQEKNRKNEFISNICANNHLPLSLENSAIYLFEKGSPRNKKKNSFAAYCIYRACKQEKVGRSLVEISRMCFIPTVDISAFLLDEEELKPEYLIERICEKLGVRDYSRKKEISDFSAILYANCFRCSPPQSSIAVALAFQKDLHLNQLDIAKACDISLSCLRRLCRTYKREIELEKVSFVKNNSK